MDLNCRPGDLAIVVLAENLPNIGLIVRVLKRHDGRGSLAVKDKGPLWTVQCHHVLTYQVGESLVRRKRGPVPDSYLRAIRGLKPTEERCELGVIQDGLLDE